MKQIFLIVLLASLLSGCKTTKLVDSKIETKRDSVTYYTLEKTKVFKPPVQADFGTSIASRVVFVHVKGDSVKRQPCVIIKQGVQKFHSKDGSLNLQFKIDSLGNIAGNFASKADSLTIELQNKHTIIKEQQKIIEQYQVQDSGFTRVFKKIGGTLLWTIIGIIVTALVLLYLYNKFRPKLI